MELTELLYVALGTIGILIALHLSTFALARMMAPAKPRIVYLPAPTAPAQPAPVAAPPPPPPALRQAAPSIQLPTYDVPVTAAPEPPAPPPGLPPPIETRNTTKQSSGDLGPPR